LAVSKEDVRKIADLARLHLDQAEIQRMTRDMNDILDYVQKLNEVDTENVSPLSWLEGKVTPMQADAVTKFDHIEEALKNAPRSEGRFFIVPKVIE